MPEHSGVLPPERITEILQTVPGVQDHPDLRGDLTVLLQSCGAAPEVADAARLLVQHILTSVDPGRALTHLLRLLERLPAPACFWSIVRRRPDSVVCLLQVLAASHFLATLLIRRPSLLSWLLEDALWTPPPPPQALHEELVALLPEDTPEDETAKRLRMFTHQHLLRIGSRDLNQLASVAEITADLSAVADGVIQAALQACQRWLQAAYGPPMYIDEQGRERRCEFSVIGMGKLGGYELNFSSDIDLMYIYTSYQGHTRGVMRDGERQRQISNHEYFVALARRLTNLLGGKGPEGQAYRVDLRLRPDGTQGQLALSLLSYESYYARVGQPWERMALIKARPLAGDAALGREFLAMITPFVFQRHLDPDGVRQLRAMKREIDAKMADAQQERTNVKLGRGGIREIEFFIQLLQLLFGGRQTALQERQSLRALVTLVEARLITPQVAETLRHTYCYLRRLEHLLQIEQGSQTHTLPRSAAQRSRLARLCGHATWEAFYEEYLRRTEAVHGIFNAGFHTTPHA
jgi:glutamate-ammonia-ligase adenylyltransferase